MADFAYPEANLLPKPVTYREQGSGSTAFWSFLQSEGITPESWMPFPNHRIYPGNFNISAPSSSRKLIGSLGSLGTYKDHSASPISEAFQELADGNSGTMVAKCSEFPYVQIFGQVLEVEIEKGIGFHNDDDDFPQQHYKTVSGSGTVWDLDDSGCAQAGYEYRGSRSFVYDAANYEWKLDTDNDSLERRRVYRAGADYDFDTCGEVSDPGNWVAAPFVVGYDDRDMDGLTFSAAFTDADYKQAAEAALAVLQSEEEKIAAGETVSADAQTILGSIGSSFSFFLGSLEAGDYSDQAGRDEYIPQEIELAVNFPILNTFHYRNNQAELDLTENAPGGVNSADVDKLYRMRIVPVLLGMSGTFRIRIFGFSRTSVDDLVNGGNTAGPWTSFVVLDETITASFDQLEVGAGVEMQVGAGSGYTLEVGKQYLFGESPFGYSGGAGLPGFVVTKV